MDLATMKIGRASLVPLCFVLSCAASSKKQPPEAPPRYTTDPIARPAPTGASATPRLCRLPVPGPRVVPAPGSQPCLPPPPGIAQRVTAALDRSARVDGDSPDLQVHVTFGCSHLGSRPTRVWALQVFGHGGSATLLGVKRSAAGSYFAEGMRVLLKDGGTPSVELLAQDLPLRAVDENLGLIQAALTATASASFPDTAGSEQLHLRPLSVSTSNVLEKMHLEDVRGIALDRTWTGYPGTDQPDRLAIDLALQYLDQWVPQKFVTRPATDEDRQLLVEAWEAGELPWFADAPLLALAGSFGSTALLDKIVARLESEHTDVQRLAVDALAAITGWDARKDKDGGVRRLSDVVADYQRECVRTDSNRILPDAGTPPPIH